MDKFITYQGIKLHYTVSGEGHPLMLLHGWGCSTEIWQRVLPFLEERFRVINVDFAGFGQSEEPTEVYINYFESKNEKVRFVRVDSDVVDKLIQKKEQLSMSLTEAQ
ncbi:MAG: alpha/beta fold hydrolase, partial [Alistipes sp.]|nr:alpha/beta fold hydrolase [Alistipes sp.]